MKVILNKGEIKEFLIDLLPQLLPECGVKMNIKDIDFIVENEEFIGAEVELADLFEPPESGVDGENCG